MGSCAKRVLNSASLTAGTCLSADSCSVHGQRWHHLIGTRWLEGSAEFVQLISGSTCEGAGMLCLVPDSQIISELSCLLLPAGLECIKHSASATERYSSLMRSTSRLSSVVGDTGSSAIVCVC